MFLAGKDLPNLSLSAARRLLDQARSALLAAGRSLKNATSGTTAEAKAAILASHRELQRAGIASGSEPIYNSANPIETQLCNGISNDRLLDEFERFKRTNPNGSLLQHLTTLHSDSPAPAAKSAPITRPATTTVPPKATTPKSVMPIAPKTKATTTRPTGKMPTPAHLIGSSVDHAGLAAAAALQAAVRRPAVTPKAPPPRPLQDVPTATLVSLATHQFSPPGDAAAARAELANRPGVSLYENGSYSVSSRGTRTAK